MSFSLPPEPAQVRRLLAKPPPPAPQLPFSSRRRRFFCMSIPAVGLGGLLWMAAAARVLSRPGELLRDGLWLAAACLSFALLGVCLTSLLSRGLLRRYANAYVAGGVAAVFVALLTLPDCIPQWQFEAGEWAGKPAQPFVAGAWGRHVRAIELHACENPAQPGARWYWLAAANVNGLARVIAFDVEIEATLPEDAVYADSEMRALRDSADGAVLRILARGADGERVMGEVSLDPVHDATQRKWQALRVRMPAGARIVLQALPGLPGANNWFDRIWVRVGSLRPVVGGCDVRGVCQTAHVAASLVLAFLLVSLLALIHARLLAGQAAQADAPPMDATAALFPPVRGVSASRAGVLVCVGLAVGVAILVRAGMLATYPLLLWSDSQMYLRTALQLAAGGDFTGYLSYSTPGYPYFLAGIITILGASPSAILVFQYVLGAAAAGFVAWVAVRLAPTPLAALLGVLFALDPVVVMWGSWALSEAVAVPLFVILLALALRNPDPQLGRAIWVGLLCALCYLVRPNLQVAVPLVLLGWTIAMRADLRLRLLLAGVGGLVFVGAILPWTIYNHERGVTEGGVGSHTLWTGLVLNGLLDHDYSLPADVREKAQPFLDAGPLDNKGAWKFASAINARQPSMWPLMKAWALHSIRQNPLGYAAAVGRAALWQLDIFPASDTVHHSQLRDFLRRTAAAERGSDPADLWAADTAIFVSERRGGPLRQAATAAALDWPGGVLEVVLIAAVLVSLATSLARRRYGVSLLACAVLAVFAVNVVFLQFPSRYSSPAWAAGYLFLAVLFGDLRELWRARRRARPRAAADWDGGAEHHCCQPPP